VTYAVPADFREPTQKHWARDLVLGPEITDALLTQTIAWVATQLELDLADRFDPPTPDNDETIDVDGSLTSRVYLPRRIRSLTSLQTKNTSGTLASVASSTYRVHSSLNAAGTDFAFDGHRGSDYIDAFGWTFPIEAGSLRLVGKFGWAVVPDDIKRLVALDVYDIVKGSSDPTSRLIQKNTADATYTYGPSREAEEIRARYSRRKAWVS